MSMGRMYTVNRVAAIKRAWAREHARIYGKHWYSRAYHAWACGCKVTL